MIPHWSNESSTQGLSKPFGTGPNITCKEREASACGGNLRGPALDAALPWDVPLGVGGGVRLCVRAGAGVGVGVLDADAAAARGASSYVGDGVAEEAGTAADLGKC